MSESVIVRRVGTVATVVLNRPEKLNAFDGALREAMAATLPEVLADSSVRVVVLTGAGRAFCAGADIGYLRGLLDTRDWKSAEALVETGRALVTAIRRAPKPVVAAVNGAAAGGGANLALACDIRIASDRASIGQTFSRIGLHPDWGATYFVPRLVGTARALELFWSGEVIGAARAADLGLFNRVVPHDALERETMRLAEGLAAKSPIAVALAKQATYASERQSLDEMLDMELAHQMQCFRSTDATEGLEAFLEKRPPRFAGR